MKFRQNIEYARRTFMRAESSPESSTVGLYIRAGALTL